MNAPTDRPDDPNLGARGEWLARVSEAASGLAASHTPEQPRGSSSGSTITVSYTSLPPSRDKSLDPTFLFAPPSQQRSRSKLAVCGGLMAIISSVAITAAIATGEFQPADIWRQLGIDRTTELASWLSRPAQLYAEQATPRLIVQSSRVSSGEPMPLGVALRGRAEGAVVIIKGLVPGMDLSAGNAVGTDAWQLLATDLGDAWIAPPEGFVGSTHLVAELRLSDEKMADQQMIQIDWVSAIAAPAGTHGQFQEIAARPLILPPPTDRQPENASAGSSIPPPQAERPPEEITAGPWTISREPTRSPGKIAAEGQRRRDVFWQLAEAAAGATNLTATCAAPTTSDRGGATYRSTAHRPATSRGHGRATDLAIAYAVPTTSDRGGATYLSAAHRPAISRGRGSAPHLAIAYSTPTSTDGGGVTNFASAHTAATRRGSGPAAHLAIAYAVPSRRDRGGVTDLTTTHTAATK